MSRSLASHGLMAIVLFVGASSARAEQTSFPPEARAKYDQAQALLKQRRYKEAIAAYEQAIQLGMKDYPRAHLNKARSLLENEEYDNAIKFYTDFLTRFGLEDSCRF